MYAGGVSGGLFVSDNGALSWTPAAGNADLASLLITTMAIDANGDLIVGTGEDGTGFFDGSQSFTHMFTGNGLYRSTDGGASFTLMPATEPTPGTLGANAGVDWAYVRRVAAHPTDANTLAVAQNGGVLYSTDAGASWTFCTDAGSGVDMSFSGADDVAFDSNGDLHAIYGGRYYRSSAGDVFALDIKEAGLPTTGLGRSVLAVAPSDANYVYVYVANNVGELRGVYRSTDGGNNFTVISPEASDVFNPPGSQGYYNLCIAVNPADPNRIYIGGQIDSWTWNASTAAWTSMTASYFSSSSSK